MNRLALTTLIAAALLSPVAHAEPAQQACEAKAVSKDGKPLAGAAKNSFMKKCVGEANKASCEERAVSKDGKKLAGAAKNSFMKKCEANPAG
ncbi:MAG: hypothetical protein ACK4FF_13460 [Limnobacter sp.]|jgi:hypothetical protein|uniref:hypothetical protein n=1 Tax=Limnobacter sp. TaxID=2003368 RepID=UPI003919ECE4